MIDTTMTLPDGRALAYTDLGPSSGPLVIYFHGAPTSRLDLIAFEDAFIALGIRVVSPDRPGYGGSSPQPGRTLEDWPADVAALADHLGRDRFAVIGMSSGGPYTVVCAALLPDRVAAAGVVAGVSDMGWSNAWDGYYEAEAAVMRIGDETEATRYCLEHYGADGGRFFESLGELAPADVALLEDQTILAGFTASVGEAFRQGVGGFAQDITVQGRAWPFDAGTIVAPVHVLHGEADTLVPLAHGRHTAELIPGATLVTRPDDGHISLLSELPQLAADLAAALR